MKFTSNARQLARRYQQRAERLNGALRKGLTRAAAQVDRAQVENLRGPKGPPGGYPVPVPTGALLQAHFFNVASYKLAVVGDTAKHAVVVHEGRGSSRPYGRRPFLDDAAASVDTTGIVQAAVREGMAV